MRVLVLAFLCCAPAAFAASGCDDLAGGPVTFNVDWQTQIKPIVNELYGGRCTSCHNSGDFSGGLDLTDYNIDAIYKIVGNQVTPGDPWNSRLFLKVDCTVPDQGVQMPKGETPLPANQRALIYDWIMQGAYGEDPLDPIYRDFIFKDGGESQRM